MSHFTVMVIGDDAEKQLAPYHEYECTGIDDEYVIDVNRTEEVEEWLKEEIYTGLSKSNGEPDYFFDEKSANDLLQAGWSVMSRIKWFDSAGKDLYEEINDYFGYRKDEETGQYFQHTNPNAKWDWYQVGGRWSGFFKVKDAKEAASGERSWMQEKNGDPVKLMHADITTKGNVDLVGMMDDIRKDCNEQFDHLVAAIGNIPPVSWKETRERIMEQEHGTIDDARDFYNNCDFKKNINAYERAHKDVYLDGFMSDIYEDFYLHLPLNQARVRYVETAAMNCVMPYAFVKDGQWVERGEMGWWGMASNEKDKDEWSQQFIKMFAELPDDTLLTVVDCHI